MNKITLKLKAVSKGHFNCLASRSVELSPERIRCNDVHFPWEHHPRNPKPALWVIGNEFGALGAVWADHESDALDELVDSGLADSILIPEEDCSAMSSEEQDDCTALGNAGEPADLTNVWMQQVDLSPEGQHELLCKFAEARGDGSDTLDN